MDDQELYVPDTPGEITNADDRTLSQQEAQRPEVDHVPQGTETPPASEDEPMTTSTVVPAARTVFSHSPAKPFTISLTLRSGAKSGHAMPAATLEIDSSLRTSGLLAALPGEEVKTLVALVTFLSANGDIKPTAYEVARALNISEGKARERLSRLVRFRWQSRPLVASLTRENGLDGFTLAHDIVRFKEGASPAAPRNAAGFRTAGREAVIAVSRAKYGHPRAQVEREIAMLNGWPLPDGEENPGNVDPAEYLHQRLLRLGVSPEQVELLTATVPTEEIERQIDWLPYRAAKNPASYLVSAIANRYAEPSILKLRRESQAGAESNPRESPPAAEAW